MPCAVARDVTDAYMAVQLATALAKSGGAVLAGTEWEALGMLLAEDGVAEIAAKGASVNGSDNTLAADTVLASVFPTHAKVVVVVKHPAPLLKRLPSTSAVAVNHPSPLLPRLPRTSATVAVTVVVARHPAPLLKRLSYLQDVQDCTPTWRRVVLENRRNKDRKERRWARMADPAHQYAHFPEWKRAVLLRRLEQAVCARKASPKTVVSNMSRANQGKAAHLSASRRAGAQTLAVSG